MNSDLGRFSMDVRSKEGWNSSLEKVQFEQMKTSVISSQVSPEIEEKKKEKKKQPRGKNIIEKECTEKMKAS